MTDLPSTKSDFDRNGFAIVRRLLEPPDFDQLRANLDRYIRDVVSTLPDSHAFYVDKSRRQTLKQLQHMGVDSYFRDYTRHPRWLELAETLLGEPVEAQEPEWFNKPPGTVSPTPPHQDNYYFCLRPPQVLTIWLSLDAVDAENGCLRYVAGSHRRGIRPHARSNILGFSQGISDFGPADEADEVCVHLEPGDAAVHHGETIHRAEPNRSATRDRRAFAMVVRAERCRRDEAAFASYMAAMKRQHEDLGLDH